MHRHRLTNYSMLQIVTESSSASEMLSKTILKVFKREESSASDFTKTVLGQSVPSSLKVVAAEATRSKESKRNV